MRFSVSCSLQWLEDVLKDSKRWLQRSNFCEFFFIGMCYVKFVDKRYRQGGRFLLVSSKRVVRFRSGFRCLVAYSGWENNGKLTRLKNRNRNRNRRFLGRKKPEPVEKNLTGTSLY